MIRLIIARHGNTFNPGEVLTRVGGRTDLPLVESGKEQAQVLGKYLLKFDLLPDVVYAAPLKRTVETARMALIAAGLAGDITVQISDAFTEIDYGPDENMPEDKVISRVGQQAIDDWNTLAKIPEGWNVDIDTIINNWRGFADSLVRQSNNNLTTMVVTSNGIARFAPYILPDYVGFVQEHNIKMRTGCLSIFHFGGTEWVCDEWNINPKQAMP